MLDFSGHDGIAAERLEPCPERNLTVLASANPTAIEELAFGNTALMQTEGISTESLAKEADGLRAQGARVMYLAVDGKLAGLLAVSDPIKKP